MAAINETRTFRWNVPAYVTDTQTATWTVGEGPLYWYLVVTRPVTTGCDLPPSGDPNFTAGHVLQYNVLASSVRHLCQRLKELHFSHKIDHIYYWSRPALECDVREAVANGESQDCNTLTEVDVHVWENVCECLEYSSLDSSLVWYSRYSGLTGVTVSATNSVIKGQRLGRLSTVAGLHFAVTDGVGQTLDLTGFFNLPNEGSRAPMTAPAGAPTFDSCQLDFVKAHTQAPLRDGRCEWEERYGDPAHDGLNYYAMDWTCRPYPQADTVGADVYCACGGPDVTSVVISIGGGSVLVRHTSSPYTDVFGFATPLTLRAAVPAPTVDTPTGPLSSRVEFKSNLNTLIPEFPPVLTLEYVPAVEAWTGNWQDVQMSYACRSKDDAPAWRFDLRVGRSRVVFWSSLTEPDWQWAPRTGRVTGAGVVREGVIDPAGLFAKAGQIKFSLGA